MRKYSIKLVALLIQPIILIALAAVAGDPSLALSQQNLGDDSSRLQTKGRNLKSNGKDCNNCKGPDKKCVGRTVSDEMCDNCAHGQTFWPCNLEKECWCWDTTGPRDPGDEDASGACAGCTGDTELCVGNQNSLVPVGDEECSACTNGQSYWPCDDPDLCWCWDTTKAKKPPAPASGLDASTEDPCSFFTEEIFNSLAPNATFPYTYDGLCRAINDYNLYHTEKAFMMGTGEHQRAELASFLGNTMHESDEFRAGREYLACGDRKEKDGKVYCKPCTNDLFDWATSTCSVSMVDKNAPYNSYCQPTFEPPEGCICDTLTQVAETGELAGYVEASKVFYGRGAIQLSWNYNYIRASYALTGSPDTFCSDPEQVVTNELYAWGSGIYFWMENQKEGTTCHKEALKGDFGGTLNNINGGLECPAYHGGWHATAVKMRINRYCHSASLLGLSALSTFDGCKGLSASYEECLSDGTCPYCLPYKGIPNHNLTNTLPTTPDGESTSTTSLPTDTTSSPNFLETTLPTTTTSPNFLEVTLPTETAQYETLPSDEETDSPTMAPSFLEIPLPTPPPTMFSFTMVTSKPTPLISSAPTKSPSPRPTTLKPTPRPTTLEPTTLEPTTLEPTPRPTTLAPTSRPTTLPTSSPFSTSAPIMSPTFSPASLPTTLPPTSSSPTIKPSFSPTTAPPTDFPVSDPTEAPSTLSPSFSPTPGSTPKPTMGPCDGDPCPSNLCRSPWGFCGPGSGYCNERSIWSASCINEDLNTSSPTPAPTDLSALERDTLPPTDDPTIQPTYDPSAASTEAPTKLPTAKFVKPEPGKKPPPGRSRPALSNNSSETSGKKPSGSTETPEKKPNASSETNGKKPSFVAEIESLTLLPTRRPTSLPTSSPLSLPTSLPTPFPSSGPSIAPTHPPSKTPITLSPTPRPTMKEYSPTDPEMTYFCGSDWGDATTRCEVRCPSGRNDDCPDGHTCYAFTGCNEVEAPEEPSYFVENPPDGTDSEETEFTGDFEVPGSATTTSRPTMPPISASPTSPPTKRDVCHGHPCPFAGECRSQYGFCGSSFIYCNSLSSWTLETCGLKATDENGLSILCDEDLHECADGTRVQRDPSNGCEFFACPDEGTGADVLAVLTAPTKKPTRSPTNLKELPKPTLPTITKPTPQSRPASPATPKSPTTPTLPNLLLPSLTAPSNGTFTVVISDKEDGLASENITSGNNRTVAVEDLIDKNSSSIGDEAGAEDEGINNGTLDAGFGQTTDDDDFTRQWVLSRGKVNFSTHSRLLPSLSLIVTVFLLL